RPACLSLFPSTTLFRSRGMVGSSLPIASSRIGVFTEIFVIVVSFVRLARPIPHSLFPIPASASSSELPPVPILQLREKTPGATRSEEHTSELQSRENLV